MKEELLHSVCLIGVYTNTYVHIHMHTCVSEKGFFTVSLVFFKV